MFEANVRKKAGDFKLHSEFRMNKPVLGILGASGCGKTMTLKAVAGTICPDSGMIRLGERVLYDSARHINLKPQKRRIGYMFQDYALFPNMTVFENIRCAAREKNVDTLLQKMQLTEYSNLYPRMLSGGQKQRTALARCLAINPAMLLLDEPFSALDSYLKDELRQELSDILKQIAVPAIIVTHDCDEAYRLCDEISVMHDGEIIEQAEAQRLFDHPFCYETARITGCENIFGTQHRENGELYIPELGISLYSDDLNAEYIGIRARELKPCSAECANAVRVFHVKSLETPFETEFVMRTQNGGELVWKTDKNPRNIPDYLTADLDKIIFLH